MTVKVAGTRIPPLRAAAEQSSQPTAFQSQLRHVLRLAKRGERNRRTFLQGRALVSAIIDASNPVLFGAMGAAIDPSLRFGAVPNHTAVAVRASGSHRLDGALEAVECHRPIALDDLERLVVIVAADIALWHGLLLSNRAAKVATGCGALGST